MGKQPAGSWGGGQVDPAVLGVSRQTRQLRALKAEACLGIKRGRQMQPCGSGWWFRKTWSLLLAEQLCGCGQVT